MVVLLNFLCVFFSLIFWCKFFFFWVQVDPVSVPEVMPQEVVEVVQTPGGGEQIAEQSVRQAVLAIESPRKDRVRSASARGFNTSTPVSLVVCVVFSGEVLFLFCFFADFKARCSVRRALVYGVGHVEGVAGGAAQRGGLRLL